MLIDKELPVSCSHVTHNFFFNRMVTVRIKPTAPHHTTMLTASARKKKLPIFSHTLFLLDYRKTSPKMEPWPEVYVLPSLHFDHLSISNFSKILPVHIQNASEVTSFKIYPQFLWTFPKISLKCSKHFHVEVLRLSRKIWRETRRMCHSHQALQCTATKFDVSRDSRRIFFHNLPNQIFISALSNGIPSGTKIAPFERKIVANKWQALSLQIGARKSKSSASAANNTPQKRKLFYFCEWLGRKKSGKKRGKRTLG